MTSRLDRDTEQLVSEHGIADVIDALSRYTALRGMAVISRRLAKIYDYLRPANDIKPPPPARRR